MDLVWSRRIAEAYATLFPRRLRQAHMALISWAEEANPDGWPTPSDVERFARLYCVPRGPLGALVGMLSRQPVNDRRVVVWVDAVRDPDAATPHLNRQHDNAGSRLRMVLCHDRSGLAETARADPALTH